MEVEPGGPWWNVELVEVEVEVEGRGGYVEGRGGMWRLASTWRCIMYKK